ncbi:MAG: hypothetical protein ACKVQV_14165 [Bacteroidia bacterium]
MWEFLKWFFDEFLDKIGFNSIMLAVIKESKLPYAAKFNITIELIIATLIVIYSIIVAFKNSSTDDILVGIDRFLISGLVCAILIVSEKWWSKLK